MEENKIEFDFEDFEEEWKEQIDGCDEKAVAKITPEEREFARGFCLAMDCLCTAIDNVVDDVDDVDGMDDLPTFNQIKKEIIEKAGETIKKRLWCDFDGLMTSTIERHVE